jgi:hypothetical protein
MADKYETFVRWYLRLNGFFTVDNFVVHEAGNGRIVPEGGEFDTIGVRFPHSREQVDRKLIINDSRLDDAEVRDHELIDFVIAEVKGGKRNTLNSIWRAGSEEKKVRRIVYLLKWMGPFKDENQIRELAIRLQRDHRARESGFQFRLVYFSHAHSQQALPRNVKQISFHEIADFIVSLRTPCWKDSGLGVFSNHEQWDKLICDVWNIGTPESLQTKAQKIDSILALLSN